MSFMRDADDDIHYCSLNELYCVQYGVKTVCAMSQLWTWIIAWCVDERLADDDPRRVRREGKRLQ